MQSSCVVDFCRGYVSDGQETYHIEPVDGPLHRIFRHSDIKPSPFVCGTDGHGGHSFLTKHTRLYRQLNIYVDYNGPVTLVATTVAHEMGHNFGMEHDNDTRCSCPQDKCIMAATSGHISPQHWSSCSQNSLQEAFELGMDYCLQDLPPAAFQGPVCGNGVLEGGGVRLWLDTGVCSSFKRIEDIVVQMKQEVNDNRTDINQLLQERNDNLSRLDQMEKNVDRLETTLRQSNLKILGLYEHPHGSDADDVDQLIELLNDCSNNRTWDRDDIDHTYRISSTRSHSKNQTRPLIVVFLRREDKISILRDRDLRYELRQRGVKVSADLTLHQREQIAYYKSQGKFAYYINGKLQVENRNYQRNENSRFTRKSPYGTWSNDHDSYGQRERFPPEYRDDHQHQQQEWAYGQKPSGRGNYSHNLRTQQQEQGHWQKSYRDEDNSNYHRAYQSKQGYRWKSSCEANQPVAASAERSPPIQQTSMQEESYTTTNWEVPLSLTEWPVLSNTHSANEPDRQPRDSPLSNNSSSGMWHPEKDCHQSPSPSPTPAATNDTEARPGPPPVDTSPPCTMAATTEELNT
ncbi:hypothetical protein ACOMHN_009274 [Nucella lapillus]